MSRWLSISALNGVSYLILKTTMWGKAASLSYYVEEKNRSVNKLSNLPTLYSCEGSQPGLEFRVSDSRVIITIAVESII